MTFSSYFIRPLSTLGANTMGRLHVMDTRNELEAVSKELSTGLKADVAKDLGMRSTDSISTRNLKEVNERYIDNNKLLENKLGMQSDIMDDIRDVAQDFMALAIGSELSPTPTSGQIQQEALAVMENLINKLNTSYNNGQLFSGIDSDKKSLNAYGETDTVTGQSPKDVIDSIVGGSITNAADAATKIASLDAIYSSTSATPANDYEATFYNGTPLLDGGGNPNPRLQAMVDKDVVIDYGVQANDESFRDILKGITMLASVDVTEISDQTAYQAWMKEALGSVGEGIDKLGVQQAALGKQRQFVEETLERQQDKDDIYNNRILALEGVDPYVAASRMSALETQLEATYATTARLSQLSFLSYMR